METILSAAQQRVEQLKAALENVLKLIEEKKLVRNIEEDDKPDWALRQMMFVKVIKDAKEALDA